MWGPGSPVWCDVVGDSVNCCLTHRDRLWLQFHVIRRLPSRSAAQPSGDGMLLFKRRGECRVKN